MPNQSSTSAVMVVNGTAPDDLSPQMSAFSTKNTANAAPGNASAVLIATAFHSDPLNPLYSRAAAYPASTPMNAHTSSIAVMRPPLFDGERRPRMAKSSVTSSIPRNCTPVPTNTHSVPARAGGRNTSPCTSFHPVSSCASSCVSSWLYLEMSRYSVLSMIMASIPDKNSTIISEFTMENQSAHPGVLALDADMDAKLIRRGRVVIIQQTPDRDDQRKVVKNPASNTGTQVIEHQCKARDCHMFMRYSSSIFSLNSFAS
uniref:Uncharacterized protein n=1 Tax=Oryza meridionalis TaxID=40149 RepID=A0A0E0E4H7_9ORYZ